MSTVNATVIPVEKLRVGMFVQLEGGWLSHPFAVSAFKLANEDQIETLRGLGLQHVKWVPEKSDLPPALQSLPAKQAADQAAESPEAVQARLHEVLLQEHREAAKRCELGREKAESELKELFRLACDHPQHAARASTALAQSMLDHMLDEDEVGIRLVNACADRDVSHALNVSVMSLLIGRTMGMSEPELIDIGVGALLHDVGKFELPARNRQLADRQTAQETQAYKSHVAHGVALGRRMGLSAAALNVLAQHHEHADGAGFPQQLAGEQISLPARVVAIVNRYDGLCNPRSGAPGLTPHEAVAMLFAQHRKRFDGSVLNAFIRMMGVYPAGSIVQLTDDRYALVVGANSSRPLKPRVLDFDPQVSRARSPLLNLEHERDLGIRRSLTAQRLPADALTYLDPRPRVSYFFEPLSAERASEARVS